MSWEAWGDPPDPPQLIPCPSCKGTGVDDDDGAGGSDGIKRVCGLCNGEGEIVIEYEPLDDDVL